MISISGAIINQDTLISQYSSNNIDRNIIEILSTSYKIYNYFSFNEFKFELDLRLNIINAAILLYKSGFRFKSFRKSMCNPLYWDRTDEGGFMMKDGTRPSDAVNDIYINGSLYGTECATAIVIIYYKALLGVYPADLYNNIFSRIYLMNWQHLDTNMGIFHYRNLEDYLPGDCRYFKNPDVDPLTTEWQGENTIDLGNSMYYGHGIGIGTQEKIITELNKHRITGSNIPAYLMDSATIPDFKHLARLYYNYNNQDIQYMTPV